MNLDDRIKTFAKLGSVLNEFLNKESLNGTHQITPVKSFEVLNEAIRLAHIKNPWFTEENIAYSFLQWSQLLTLEDLTHWTNNYDFESGTSKKVAIIMAGNIPLV